MFALLKQMVIDGAYTQRKNAEISLRGFFTDVSHISTYAPYCDAFVMDKAMAEMVNNGRLDISKKYGVQIFSLNNWQDFFDWLDKLKANLTEDHKQGLRSAYPWIEIPS